MILYRIWNKQANEYLYWGETKHGFDSPPSSPAMPLSYVLENSEMYTGKDDHTGRKIFAGSVMRCIDPEDNSTFVISWQAPFFRKRYIGDNCVGFEMPFANDKADLDFVLKWFEVIGNFRENFIYTGHASGGLVSDRVVFFGASS